MDVKNPKKGKQFENAVGKPVSESLGTGLFGNILKVKNWISGIAFQDGFYEGELMNGKHGLVPSNFIEKVPGRFTEILLFMSLYTVAFYSARFIYIVIYISYYYVLSTTKLFTFNATFIISCNL